VIYRTGGTDNFKWNKASAVMQLHEAIAVKVKLNKMGYPAIIHRTKDLNAIGMPDTYGHHSIMFN
jgi:hypothetical protein